MWTDLVSHYKSPLVSFERPFRVVLDCGKKHTLDTGVRRQCYTLYIHHGEVYMVNIQPETDDPGRGLYVHHIQLPQHHTYQRSQ